MEKLQNFGWELNPKKIVDRKKYPKLNSDFNTDWLIVGCGLTGLSALNQLKKYKVNHKISIVDAGRIGQGSSSRNSGFLVDSTLNNGSTSISNLKDYKKKYALNLAGMSELRTIIKENEINCDWSEDGKFHASANKREFYKLERFGKLLRTAGVPFKESHEDELNLLLGTSFYKYAIKTHGGVLLNPQKLVQGLIKKIDENINIFENTKIIKFSTKNDLLAITADGFKISAKKIIVAVNSELPSLNIKKYSSLPLILTSSITRNLTQEEQSLIGNPLPWGVLSVKPTGATVRYTNDNRILIRNTSSPFKISKKVFGKNKNLHREGLKKRFPMLKNLSFENSWSGMISVSSNGNPLFGNIKEKIFYAGVFNGGGLGLSVLYGAAMIDSALKISNTRLKIVEEYPQANLLPPLPKIAAFLRIKLDKIFGSNET